MYTDKVDADGGGQGTDPARRPAGLSTFARDAAGQHPGESGCVLLEDGRTALLARLALAGLAARTLDVQYYLWHDDMTGRRLARSLLDAADRGVQIRMLIDDIHLAGRDTGLAVLDSHRNIEIRIFNPFKVRQWPSWRRVVEVLLEGRRLGRRMHNKVFIADQCLATVGGRNIGDEYFAAGKQANFRDMDLLVLGPVVPDIGSSFEHFWNSTLAVPVPKLIPFRPTRRFIRRWFRRLRRFQLQKTSPASLGDIGSEGMRRELERLQEKLTWGRARAVYDLPEKITGSSHLRIAQALLYLMSGTERELLVETAYFVPDETSLGILASLRARGVSVRILTNSLASNDVIAAHAGYAPARPALLAMGIDLFEARSRDARRAPTVAGTQVGSRASVHSKVAVFDRSTVFIGTFNFDPRSVHLNTEIGLIVESPGLAGEVAKVIGDALDGGTSFRVTLAEGGLRWRTEGPPVEEHTTEPEAGFARRMLARIYGYLPIRQWL